MRRLRGFTLLEILVVVLIIGIVIGLATLAIQDNPERRVQTEAQRIAALVRLASQEAILQSKEIAVVFERDGYHFLVYEDSAWAKPEDRVFRARRLPGGLELSVAIEGESLNFEQQENRGKRREPRIYLLSGGEATPFELTIRDQDRNLLYRIRGDIGGRLELDV